MGTSEIILLAALVAALLVLGFVLVLSVRRTRAFADEKTDLIRRYEQEKSDENTDR